MTAKDFINIDSDVITTELPTDEDIINDILISEGVNVEEEVEEEDVSEESEEESAISIEEGRKAFENAKKFLEQQEFATENDVKYVNKLIKRLNSYVDKESLLSEFYFYFKKLKSREMINCFSYIPQKSQNKRGDIKEV